MARYYLEEDASVVDFNELVRVMPNLPIDEIIKGSKNGINTLNPEVQTFDSWGRYWPTQDLVDQYLVTDEKTGEAKVWYESSQIKDKIDFSSVDVSFISLKHILPNLNTFLKDDGSAVCLIKPQFEAGKEKVGKKGVVSDPKTHLEVCEKVIGLAIENGFSVAGLDFSPIKGPEGNIEYLIYLLKSDKPYVYENVNAKDLVYKSHEEL